MRSIALRYLAENVVTPGSGISASIQLENISAGTPQLVGELPVLDGATQNQFRRGDVLFAKLRPYLSKSWLVNRPMQGTSEFLCMRPNQSVSARFLLYVTLSQPWLQHAIMSSYGMKMPRTSWDQMAGFKICVPSVDEQRRIADFLDDRVSRIDRIIAARRQQSLLVRERERSSLSGLLDHQASLRGLAPLRRFCGGIEQGASPVAEDRLAGVGEVGVLKTSAIAGGRFLADAYKAVEREVVESRYLVRNGDVIITRGSGSAALVGDAAVVEVPEGMPELYLSDLVYRLRRVEMLTDYVVLGLTSARGRSALGARVRQGSGPAKARGDDIMEIPIPVAQLEEQQAVVVRSKEVRADADVAIAGLTSIFHRGDILACAVSD